MVVSLLSAVALAAASAVPSPSPAPARPVPAGVTLTPLGTWSVERLNAILTTERAAFSPQAATYRPATNAVRLFKVTYPSVIPELGDRPTVATGLLAVPEGVTGPRPLVSYQHGTVFSKTEVPSRPEESAETRLVVAAFAGRGSVVIAADYFGKGDSAEPDSYLVRASTEQACLDLLRVAPAAAAVEGVEPGPLFLTGWSQGGWNTMIFLHRLETLGHPVRAAATASAPNDLFALINRWIHAPQPGDAVFLPGLLALQLHAFEHYHALPGLADASLQPSARAAARGLYENTLTWEQAAPQLPARVADLLAPAVIAASSTGDSRYWQLLQAGTAYRWRMRTPLRSYYGTADEVVPPEVARLPVAFQTLTGGTPAEAIEVLDGNHRGTFVVALAAQQIWFEALAEE